MYSRRAYQSSRRSSSWRQFWKSAWGVDNLPQSTTGPRTFPFRAYLNYLSEFLVHALLKMRRHGCSRTLSASVFDEEAGSGGRGKESGKLAQTEGSRHRPTRQWDSRKDRPLPAARLLHRSKARFGNLLLERRGNGKESVARRGRSLWRRANQWELSGTCWWS